MQKSIEVAPDIGRRILLDQQRRGGVRDVEGVTDKIIAELKAGRVCGRPAADLLRRHPAEDLSAILEPGFV
jgi:hypothetical protein